MSDTTTVPRKRMWWRVLIAVVVVLVAVVAGLYAFLGSQAALDYVVRRAIDAAQGHLAIDGAQGSLLSTVRVERIRWTGDEADETRVVRAIGSQVEADHRQSPRRRIFVTAVTSSPGIGLHVRGQILMDALGV